MSYRQKSTYRRVESVLNRESAWIRPLAITHKDFGKVEEIENCSPVGSIKDTYGYIGFTSHDS